MVSNIRTVALGVLVAFALQGCGLFFKGSKDDRGELVGVQKPSCQTL